MFINSKAIFTLLQWHFTKRIGKSKLSFTCVLHLNFFSWSSIFVIICTIKIFMQLYQSKSASCNIWSSHNILAWLYISWWPTTRLAYGQETLAQHLMMSVCFTRGLVTKKCLYTQIVWIGSLAPLLPRLTNAIDLLFHFCPNHLFFLFILLPTPNNSAFQMCKPFSKHDP